MTLFCFPFAGGSKHSFRGYQPYVPPGLRLVAVELPGRGARIMEPLIDDLHLMVEDIMQQIRSDLNRTYSLYGHSMGALLVYLVAHRIKQEGYHAPRHLFLTGCRAPATLRKDRMTHQLPGDEFWKKIEDLGGLPDGIVRDRTFMEYFEPILRSDFKAVETFVYTPADPLSVPVSVVVGTEENMTDDDLDGWKQETTAAVKIRKLPGNHFFIFQHEQEIMRQITHDLGIVLSEI